MKRHALPAALIAALALPASALAAGTSRGVVLSADAHTHTVQLVDARHIVHAYRYSGAAPRLTPGSVLNFRLHGTRIAAVRVAGHARSVSYYASVVRSSHRQLRLRLADGRTVSFSSRQVKHVSSHHVRRSRRVLAHIAAAGLHAADVTAPGITININGLAPGETVLVNESVAPDGSITISITLPSSVPAGATGGDQTATGVVSDVGDDTFTVDSSDGSSLVFHMAAGALDDVGMSPCDVVTVTYHTDSGMLVADNVDDSGTSDQGSCASGGSGSDASGPIVSVSGSSITINTQDNGPMTFSVDPSSGLTDGFVAGDVVDVTYEQADDGTLTADDVEYVEQAATGTVASVSAGAMTIIDADTGATDAFVADPAAGMFDGIQPGDQVDVVYHQNGDQLLADDVEPQSGGGSGS